MNLNGLALQRCELLISQAEILRLSVAREEGGTRVVDCGVRAPGGLAAGLAMAEVCLANLARVQIVPGNPAVWRGPAVAVHSDQPVAACMASQYAGWSITGGKFFAMGSGPMRVVRGREAIFDRIGFRESSPAVVGVLESGRLPPSDICRHVAEECQVRPDQLTLLVAPTASLAGTIQVVARSIETALHKLYELGFDLRRVVSGFGVAPLPPVAADDLSGIGRTNDAVLYGGEVTLWVRGDDASLLDVLPKTPSHASSDHGQPFREIFERYDRDFYKIDPLLFSPAVVSVVSLDSGRYYRYGETAPEVLQRSFEK